MELREKKKDYQNEDLEKLKDKCFVKKKIVEKENDDQSYIIFCTFVFLENYLLYFIYKLFHLN